MISALDRVDDIVKKGDKRTMMVLYRLPEYQSVKFYRDDKYRSYSPNCNEKRNLTCFMAV